MDNGLTQSIDQSDAADADADGAADVDLEKGEGGRPQVRPPTLLLLWWAID